MALSRLLSLAGLPQAMLLEDAGIPGVDHQRLAKLAEMGFDLAERLYHGTSSEFSAFDRARNRTASDIYTAPDRDTAAAYGPHLYLCVGRQEPQANLIDDHALIGKLCETFAEEFYDAIEGDEGLEEVRQRLLSELRRTDPDASEWDVEDDPKFRAAQHRAAVAHVYDLISGGQIYGTRGSLQDQIMGECFGSGYRSVRFADPSPDGGGHSESVVFHDPNDLVILSKLR